MHFPVAAGAFIKKARYGSFITAKEGAALGQHIYEFFRCGQLLPLVSRFAFENGNGEVGRLPRFKG